MPAYVQRVGLAGAYRIIAKRLEALEPAYAGVKDYRPLARIQLLSALRTGKIRAICEFTLGPREWDFHPEGWEPDPPAAALFPDGPYRERWVPAEVWSYPEIDWDLDFVYRDVSAGREIFRGIKIARTDLNRLWPDQAPIESHFEPNTKRTRGRSPTLRTAVEKAMRAKIDAGELSLSELDQMKEEPLREMFSASRDTVRKARNSVVRAYNDKARRELANDK